jgi:vitamin B12 transporter
VGDAVVVTATRTEAPLSQLAVSATVFTNEDLDRRQMPLVADLLQLSPGTMVIRNGGRGAVTSLFVRGGESDYNKVLLDGIPLNEPGGNFYFNNLTTEHLDRVEIVRGAYSSLFGSDAMASVIQLFTATPDRSSRSPHVSGQVDGGTYDTLHLSVGASGVAGQMDYSLGAARFASDNRVPNSRLENNTFSANVGLAVASRATLRFIGRGELERVGTPGTTAFGRPDLDAFFRRHDVVAGVSFDQQLSAVRQRIAYSIADSSQTSTNLIEDPPYVASFEGRTAQFTSSDFLFDNDTNLRRHHLNYQADWRFSRRASGDHLLTVLADWDGERATLENRLAGDHTTASRDNVGTSLQYQALWPRVFVTIGGRLEHNESFGTEAVPRASVAVVARPGSGNVGETRVRGSFGMGIKEPSMLESFGLSFFARGNPDLEPERSRSFEIGVDQRFGRDRAKIELAYFDNRFEDLIWTQTTDFTTFEGRYVNLVGLSRAQGMEAVVDAAPFQMIRVRAGYTFLASRIVESNADTPVFQEGQWAFRRPRHSGYAGMTLEWQRLLADVNGLFVGRFVDNDFGLFDPAIVEIPAQTTWDLRLGWRLTRRATLMAAIDNLTDRDYMQPIGYQTLRRVVRAGLRVRL